MYFTVYIYSGVYLRFYRPFYEQASNNIIEVLRGLSLEKNIYIYNFLLKNCSVLPCTIPLHLYTICIIYTKSKMTVCTDYPNNSYIPRVNAIIVPNFLLNTYHTGPFDNNYIWCIKNIHFQCHNNYHKLLVIRITWSKWNDL